MLRMNIQHDGAYEKPKIDFSSMPKHFKAYYKKANKFHQDLIQWQMMTHVELQLLERRVSNISEIKTATRKANRYLENIFQKNTDLNIMFQEILDLTDAVQEMLLTEGMEYFSSLTQML